MSRSKSDAGVRKGHSVPLWRQLKHDKAGAREVLSLFGIEHPPVDVEALISMLDIELRFVKRNDWSGAVQVVDGEAYIWCSIFDARVRRRFTLAHELGHLLLHPEPELEIAYRDTSFAGDRREIEANAFAAELLMPQNMLRQYVDAYGPNAKLLAHRFEVSDAAMNVRLGKLVGMR